MESMFGIGFVIVFQKDGLKLDEVIEGLKTYGKVLDMDDAILDNTIPVKLVYMTTDGLAPFFRIKRDYNLKPAPGQSRYILYPMAS